MPEDLPNFPDHVARYAFALHWVPGKSVVDLCCGTGYGTRLLSAGGATHVLGIDIDSRCIEQAVKNHGSEKLRFICQDVLMPIPQPSSNLIVCFEGIEHVIAPESLVSNIAENLTNDGIALISTPNASYYPGGCSGNPYHLKEFSLHEFQCLLAQYFDKVSMYFQWSYRDPYDVDFRLSTILKMLMPIRIKQALKGLFHRQQEKAAQHKATAPDPMAWRPYPLNYLSQPGLRGAQPHNWLAVCAMPIRNKMGSRI